MLKITALLFITFFGLAACSGSVNENSFADAGAGLQLYSGKTPDATANLSNYFRELCYQADPLGSSQARADGTAVTCAPLSVLVRTGFNDIDLRCDRYLAWIDKKRTEGVKVKSGITATGGLLSGVLPLADAGGNALAYVGQVLGFASSVYDAYNNSLLLGLENSTIKKIVYERRQEYRTQFVGFNYTSNPDAVYALRGYLRICTPQTIVLDANSYAFAGASGIAPPKLSDSIGEEMSALTGIERGTAPVTPGTSGSVNVDRGTPTCEACEAIFPKGLFSLADIVNIQTGLCVNPDGKPGAGTIEAVKIFRQTQGFVQGGKLQPNEISDLNSDGCKPGDLERGFLNFYEVTKFKGNDGAFKTANLKILIDNMNEVISENQVNFDPITIDILKNKTFRDRIVASRVKFNLNAGSSIKTQVTDDLFVQISRAAFKSRQLKTQ